MYLHGRRSNWAFCVQFIPNIDLYPIESGFIDFLKKFPIVWKWMLCCVHHNQWQPEFRCYIVFNDGGERGGKNSKSSLDTQVIFSVSAFCLKSSSSSMTTNLCKSLFVSQTLSTIKDWDVVGHQYNYISVQSHNVRFKLSPNQLFALHHNLNWKVLSAKPQWLHSENKTEKYFKYESITVVRAQRYKVKHIFVLCCVFAIAQLPDWPVGNAQTHKVASDTWPLPSIHW